HLEKQSTARTPQEFDQSENYFGTLEGIALGTDMNTALPARLSRILANIPEAMAFHVYDGRQLERWMEGKQARQDGNSERAPKPRPARHHVAGRQHERGTIEQAMAILGLPKRTIQQKAQRNEIPGAVKIFGRWTFDIDKLR